jgi:hypothetical protein
MVGGPGGGRRGGDPRPLAAALHEAHDLAQPLEGERRRWVSWRRISRRARIVGRTHGECSVGPIREPHDEVGINALADAHDGDALAAQGVMGMGNGHRSRRRLG